ncbi:MAG TPA: DUF892 family protein [Pedobacter sp.]|nr:DUF892 family protein [Pedobacter sp.]
MKIKPHPLTEIYHNKLNMLLSTEQQCLTCFSKLSFTAFTHELRAGLTPDSFDQKQHIVRLKQCLSLAKVKHSKVVDETMTALLKQAEQARKLTRSPSLSRDLALLAIGLKILNVNQGCYHELLQIAGALEQEVPGQLLEQSWKDHQNACNYLSQLAANVLYPEVLKPS